jgi:hypothetical protein
MVDLASLGFTDKGYCPVCSGRARKWIKSVNGRTATLKVREEKGTFILEWKGTVTKTTIGNLQTVLERNALI